MATFSEISFKGRAAMVLLALQFSLTPYVAGWVHRTSTHQYNSTAGILVAEVLKIAMAVMFVFLSQGGLVGLRNVYGKWRVGDSLKTALIPAFLFGLQDLLTDFANRPQNKCDPIIFLVLNQTKILFGALFLWVVLRVQRSEAQWLGLFMMFVGAVMLSYDSTKEAVRGSGSVSLVDQPVWGIAAALGAAVISGFNQMMSEYITRIKPYRRPEMLFASELAVYKIVFMTIFYFAGPPNERGFWVGIEARTLLLLAVVAAGGLCVALVSAQAGGDWKGYSLIAGLIFSCVMDFFFVRTDQGVHWVKLGSILIIIVSVYIYNRFPVKVRTD